MNRQRLQQRAYSISKYPAINWPPMDPALNTTVQAILDAERIEGGAHGRDNSARCSTPCGRRRCGSAPTTEMRDLRNKPGGRQYPC